jgi:hypothetical protein
MGITREQSKTISAEIKAAAEQILTKHGLTIDKTMSHYGAGFDIKITASTHTIDDNGINTNSREMDALKYYAAAYGITNIEADIAAPIHINGKDYIPAGYRTRASKQPFIMRDIATGKDYVFPAAVVKYFPSYDPTQGYLNPSPTHTYA